MQPLIISVYPGLRLVHMSLGAAGLGFIGGAGSHVDAVGGNASWITIAHELGHNFGLFHANRFLSRSERPYSDDGEPIDYGNPFAVMGSGSGYMTVPAKVATNVMSGFGYSIGLNSGTDVVQLYSRDDISSAKENDLHVEDSDFNNTFRIYRHDYNSPPLSLNLYDFDVSLPENIFTSGTLASNRNLQRQGFPEQEMVLEQHLQQMVRRM